MKRLRIRKTIEHIRGKRLAWLLVLTGILGGLNTGLQFANGDVMGVSRGVYALITGAIAAAALISQFIYREETS